MQPENPDLDAKQMQARSSIVNGFDIGGDVGVVTGDTTGFFLLGNAGYQQTQVLVVEDHNDENGSERNSAITDKKIGLRTGAYAGHFWGDIGLDLTVESSCGSDGSFFSCTPDEGALMTGNEMTAAAGFDFGDKSNNDQYSRLGFIPSATAGFNLTGKGPTGLSLVASGQFMSSHMVHLYENQGDYGDFVRHDIKTDTRAAATINPDGPTLQFSLGVTGSFSGEPIVKGVKRMQNKKNNSGDPNM